MQRRLPVARPRCALSLGLAYSLAVQGLVGVPPPQAATQPGLNILVVEGEGAVNNIRQRIAREPIVQVEDENHRPVAGATVIFFLPESGPSGLFPGGARSLTVFTDQKGRATALGLRPNEVPGKFQIRVTASSKGMTGSTVITQTNVLAAAAAAGAVSAKLIAILVIAGGAIAGGVAAATLGGKNDVVIKNGNGNGPTTIAAGVPRVGPPPP